MKNIVKFLLLILSLNLFAYDNYPMTGIVYGVKESKQLKYDCKKNSNDILSCDFEMATVRMKLKKSDYEEKLKKDTDSAVAEFKELKPKKTDDCKKKKEEMKDFIDIYEGKKPLPPNAKISREQIMEYSKEHKSDFKTLINLVTDMECNPSEKLYRKLAKYNVDKELRTCLVGSQSFKQSFKRAGGVWINNTGPVGVCGTVDLSRFEKPKGDFGDLFWNYISEKKITNKSATNGLLKCSDFDEAQYDFVWNGNDAIPVSCDYIEWSLF